MNNILDILLIPITDQRSLEGPATGHAAVSRCDCSWRPRLMLNRTNHSDIECGALLR
jgi:hypothetical protein